MVKQSVGNRRVDAFTGAAGLYCGRQTGPERSAKPRPESEMSDLSRRDLMAASAALAALAAAPIAAAQPSANSAASIPLKWDLKDLYPTPQAWTAERDAVAKALPGI